MKKLDTVKGRLSVNNRQQSPTVEISTTSTRKVTMDKYPNHVATMMAEAHDDKTFIMVHRKFVSFTGSLEAGILLNKLLYWTPRSTIPGGWIAKSDREFLDELCFTRYALRAAREHLESMGILRTETRRFMGSPTVHYVLDVMALNDKWDAFLEQDGVCVSEPIAEVDEQATPSPTDCSKTDNPLFETPRSNNPLSDSRQSIVRNRTIHCSKTDNLYSIEDGIEDGKYFPTRAQEEMVTAQNIGALPKEKIRKTSEQALEIKHVGPVAPDNITLTSIRQAPSLNQSPYGEDASADAQPKDELDISLSEAEALVNDYLTRCREEFAPRQLEAPTQEDIEGMVELAYVDIAALYDEFKLIPVNSADDRWRKVLAEVIGMATANLNTTPALVVKALRLRFKDEDWRYKFSTSFWSAPEFLRGDWMRYITPAMIHEVSPRLSEGERERRAFFRGIDLLEKEHTIDYVHTARRLVACGYAKVQ